MFGGSIAYTRWDERALEAVVADGDEGTDEVAGDLLFISRRCPVICCL